MPRSTVVFVGVKMLLSSPHHKFDKGSTHVSKSTLITVAEVFVAFLELELH